jgi:hypothetical protein
MVIHTSICLQKQHEAMQQMKREVEAAAKVFLSICSFLVLYSLYSLTGSPARRFSLGL